MTAIKPTIYLVKNSITNPAKLIREGRSVSKEGTGDVTVFYEKSHTYTPEWAHFLFENFNVATKHFNNASARALIVIKLPVAQRMVVIPLGGGHHLLDFAKLEYNFGLRTALNCIPKTLIRQIDTTTPEANSQKTKKQAARNTTPEEFGVNKQKDILRGITGKLNEKLGLGTSVDGKDGLRITASAENQQQLIALCEKALGYFVLDNYKKDYGWIDNIALVRDQPLIDSLDTQLAGALKKKKFTNMFFVPPEYYEVVFDFKGFVFSSGDRSRLSKKDALEMPDMDDWAAAIGDRLDDLTKDNLEKYRVLLLDEDEKPAHTWPLQRCLYWEIKSGKKQYLLSEGSWYSVADNFYSEVNTFYEARVKKRKELPPGPKGKIRESDYNFSLSSDPDRYLFDLGHATATKKSFMDGNEICDVYDKKTKTFYHAKIGKTSPLLGHLFRQGAFSGEALRREPAACQKFRDHLTADGCPPNEIADPFDPRDYQIVFVLILGKTQKKNIPFFSKVSFRDAAQGTLELIGYKPCEIAFVGGKA